MNRQTNPVVHRRIPRHTCVTGEQVFDRIVRIRMARYKINRRAVFLHISQKRCYPVRRRRRRSTHPQPRAHGFQVTRRVVIQLKIAAIPGNSVPEINVRLIPDLEVPQRHLVGPITLDQVLPQGRNQRIPALHRLRRRHILLVPERVQRIRIKRQLLGHKADLNHRLHAVLQKSVVDLVHIREVVHRIAMLILRVHAVFIVQNAVRPHVAHPGHTMHRPQIVAVAFAQPQIRPPRAKHLLPKVRKRGRRRMRIDFDPLLSENHRRQASGNGNDGDQPVNLVHKSSHHLHISPCRSSAAPSRAIGAMCE